MRTMTRIPAGQDDSKVLALVGLIRLVVALRVAFVLAVVVVASAFVWLFILIAITMSDYLSRGWLLGRPAA